MIEPAETISIMMSFPVADFDCSCGVSVCVARCLPVPAVTVDVGVDADRGRFLDYNETSSDTAAPRFQVSSTLVLGFPKMRAMLKGILDASLTASPFIFVMMSPT